MRLLRCSSSGRIDGAFVIVHPGTIKKDKAIRVTLLDAFGHSDMDEM
jgi:hypothetical protein